MLYVYEDLVLYIYILIVIVLNITVHGIQVRAFMYIQSTLKFSFINKHIHIQKKKLKVGTVIK